MKATKAHKTKSFRTTAPVPLNPFLPTEVLARIAIASRNTRTLFSMHLVCKLWNSQCASEISKAKEKIEVIALKSAASGGRKAFSEKETKDYASLALDYAIWRLTASTPAPKVLESTQLSHGFPDNLPLSSRTKWVGRLCKTFFSLRNLDYSEWEKMVTLLQDDKAYKYLVPMLTLHPTSAKIFTNDEGETRRQALKFLKPIVEYAPSAVQLENLAELLKQQGKKFRFDADRTLSNVLVGAQLEYLGCQDLVTCADAKLSDASFIHYAASVLPKLSETSENYGAQCDSLCEKLVLRLGRLKHDDWRSDWSVMARAVNSIHEHCYRSWKVESREKFRDKILMGLAENIEELVAAIPIKNAKARIKLLTPLLNQLYHLDTHWLTEDSKAKQRVKFIVKKMREEEWLPKDTKLNYKY